MTPFGPRRETAAQRGLMAALAHARVTEEGPWHFATNGEHPVIRLARLVGEPTRKERAELIVALVQAFTVDPEDAADAVLDFFASRAMGTAA